MSASIEIRAPSFPESVENGTLASWHKNPGDTVSCDELIADVETDKVVLEVLAPEDGVLTEILCPEGTVVDSAQPIARFNAVAEIPALAAVAPTEEAEPDAESGDSVPPAMSAAVRRLVTEHDLDPQSIRTSGRRGRLTATDVKNHLRMLGDAPPVAAVEQPPAQPQDEESTDSRPQRRVPMSRLRLRVAERLLQVSRETAMLTTFNEVDMSAVIALRREAGEAFALRHGVKLGFLSFFVHAVAQACQRWPVLNASIDGSDIVYHGYLDIGIAVATERGLVVPVLRDADRLGFAAIERSIGDYGQQARDGRLRLEDIRGGTFTISNGGVYGSLLSTPLLNPPQVGILGMHRIQQRPVAIEGAVQIRPMMNLALSYDHRLVDGREAVGFLVAVREVIEQPARLLLDLEDKSS